MKFEKNLQALPADHTLPLDVKKSRKIAKHGESTVWDMTVHNSEEEDVHIVLKQIEKERFATPAEMKKTEMFYEFLKDSPLAKFVPDTLHFIGNITKDAPTQGFRIQSFIQGRPIEKISDQELYQDPAVVRQLLEFVDAASIVLKAARKVKTLQPDFRWAPGGSDFRATIGGLLSDPRYSKNIVIADQADEKGQRVFFVDTGVNATERTVKREELLARHVVNPLERLHFRLWKIKLKEALEKFSKQGHFDIDTRS